MNFIKELSWAQKIKHSIRFAVFVILVGTCLSLLPRWYQKGFSKPEARASGTTYHVCTSGCDFQTLNEASQGVAAGDTIIVDATYLSTDEPFVSPEGVSGLISFGKNSLTIDCQNNPIVIGLASTTQYKISFSGNNITVQNCSFKNISIETSNFHNYDGFRFIHNSFDRTAKSSINLNAGPLNSTSTFSNFVVQDNTDIGNLDAGATLATGTVSNNTFYTAFSGAGFVKQTILIDSATSTNIQFVSNTIYYAQDSNTAINLDLDDVTFVSNTIYYLSGFSNSAAIVLGVVGLPGMRTEAKFVFAGNKLVMPDSNEAHVGILVISGENVTLNGLITHNVILFPKTFPSDSDSAAVGVSAFNTNNSILNVTSSFNIVYSPLPLTSAVAFRINNTDTTNSLLNVQYDSNGIYNVASTTDNGLATFIPLDNNTRYANPMFVASDPITSSNLSLMPFSNYLDASEDIDIGIATGTRRNVITINSAGPVDYASIDATTTAYINDFVRSGDTINIANGYYPSFSVASPFATTSVTIQGVGTNTVIVASTTPTFASTTFFSLSGLTFNLFDNPNGLLVDNVRTSTFSNIQFISSSSTFSGTDVLLRSSEYLTFTSSTFFKLNAVSASTTALYLDGVRTSTFQRVTVKDATYVSTAYWATAATYSFGGVDYGGVGNYQGFFDTGNQIFLNSLVSNVSSVNGIGTDDMNLALVVADAGATRITAFVPNSSFSTADAFETFVHNFAADARVDVWVPSAFSVLNGSYTYNESAVNAAGAVVDSGLVDPPAIYYRVDSPGGIKVSNSDNNLFDSITSTNNGVGLYFTGTSNNNIVSTSIFSANLGYDVESDASGNNILKNINFNIASSSVFGLGNLNYYFRVRALVQKRPFIPLGNVDVNFKDDFGSPTTTLTTDINGYTPFSDFLLSIIMTNTANSAISGGYNPFTISIASSTDYVSSTLYQNVIQGNQTIYLFTAPTTTPITPSNFVGSGTSTSSIHVTWTDNSSGLGQETYFILGRITGNNQTRFPGTEAIVPANSTATTTNGLSTNTGYTYRIAGFNSAGTSVYATSSLVYTLASIPGAPTIGATGESTVPITIDPNDNPTTTEFAIYNSTSNVFLNALGSSNGSVPVWQTTSTWGSNFSATGLNCVTAYSFSVLARNGNAVRTATSTAAGGTTSSCSTSGGSGTNTTHGTASGGWYNSPNTTNDIPTLPLTTFPGAQNSSSTTSTLPVFSWTSTVNSLFINPIDGPEFKIGDTAHYTYGFKNNSGSAFQFQINRSLRDNNNQDVSLVSKVVTLQSGENFQKLGGLEIDKSLFANAYSIVFSVKNGISEIGSVQVPITITHPKISKPNTSFIFTEFLTTGSKGAAVVALQKKLTALGFYRNKISGAFDLATKQAVIKLQIKYKLKPAAGYVGPGTRSVLNSK